MPRKLKNAELKRLNTEEFRNADKSNLVVVLDNVRSLHNVGSVFRTADAFRVELLCLCGITGTPPDKGIEKAALGASQSVAWKYFENTLQALDELKKEGYTIIAIEQTDVSISLNKFNPLPGLKYALIFGNEVDGIHDEVLAACDAYVEIPQMGTKHSFNIAVSAGIILWDLTVKLKNELGK